MKLLKEWNKNHFMQQCAGFTLVELMVALAVFVVVLGIIVGGFTQSIRAQRSVAAMIAVNNNMSLTLEQIAREIRVGRNFCIRVDETAPTDQPSCITSIASFDSNNSSAVTSDLEFQRVRGNGLTVVCYKYPGDGSIWRGESVGICHSVPPNPTPTDLISAGLSKITAPNVNIKSFDFLISNKPRSAFPWRFTIRMTVAPASAASTAQDEHIQTTISARFLPFEH